MELPVHDQKMTQDLLIHQLFPICLSALLTIREGFRQYCREKSENREFSKMEPEGSGEGAVIAVGDCTVGTEKRR